jgi:alkylated DNA repair dioxygenase AlkB
MMQHDLFAPSQIGPEGFRYQPEFLSSEQEKQLLEEIPALPFKEFDFHGFLGKRRVVSFGYRYDYGQRSVFPADPIPAFLLPVRDQAAAFAKLPAEEFRQALVTEYKPGAAIGWHRDKAVYGEVIGVSLLSSCNLRFRRARPGGWERQSIMAEPRSVYLLSGPARTEWEHSIPPVPVLRYSVTFRRYAQPGGPE